MDLKRTRLIYYPVWCWAAFAFTGFGALVAIYKWLSIRATRYRIEGDNVIEETGMFKTRKNALPIRSLSLIGLKQNQFEKLFGFGDIFMADADGNKIVMRHVSNPMEPLKKIQMSEGFTANVLSC